MSAIDSIFTAIYNFSVNYSTDVSAVHAWNYTDLDASKQPACPQRYLAVSGSNEGNLAFVAIGKMTSIEWTIEDTLLMKAATEGDALKENSADLIAYAKAYITAVRNARGLTAQSHITDVQIVPGIYYWPDDSSGIPYVGVRCTLTVQEVISD
jgi:hypothetical protein